MDAEQSADEAYTNETTCATDKSDEELGATSTKILTESGAKVTTVATEAHASAAAPAEPTEPADFPAYHPRVDNAYTSFDSVNLLLARGDGEP